MRKYDVIHIFHDGGRVCSILESVSYNYVNVAAFKRLMSIYQRTEFRRRNISIHDYNYFHFAKKNVHHDGVLLLVLISQSAYYFASECQISSKSDHSLQKYDVILIFQNGGRRRLILHFCTFWCHCIQKVQMCRQSEFRRYQFTAEIQLLPL